MPLHNNPIPFYLQLQLLVFICLLYLIMFKFAKQGYNPSGQVTLAYRDRLQHCLPTDAFSKELAHKRREKRKL
jgi:hypothetical protein